MPRAKKTAVPTSAPMIAYKGFDQELACRGFQYRVGESFSFPGTIVCCENGAHSCEMPLDVLSYYPPATSRFAQIEAGGTIDRFEKDTKLASAEITIKAEIKLPDLIKRAADWIVAAAKENVGQGNSGHAAATGERGHAAATGNWGHAATTGNWGHAATTGYSGHAAATGTWGHAAATGDSGHAAATGDSGHAAATGYSGHAATTGNWGHAATTGYSGIAASLGINGTAMAGADGWIVLAAWKLSGTAYEIVAVRAARVGGPEDVKAGVAYRLTEAGDFEECAAP